MVYVYVYVYLYTPNMVLGLSSLKILHYYYCYYYFEQVVALYMDVV